MAEGFARNYGKDVLAPSSAGVYPANRIAPDTLRAMAEKNLTLDGQFPKSIEQVDRSKYDLIVDISGGALEPEYGPPVRVWDVPDPIVMDYRDHCHVRDQIEYLVLNLVHELRGTKHRAAGSR
jgi:protein-tyrosine-phosphatase